MKHLLLFVRNELRLIFRDKRAIGLLYFMPALLVFTLSGVLKDLYENQNPRLSILIHSPVKTVVGDKIVAELSKTQKSVAHVKTLPSVAPDGVDLLISVPQNLPELLRTKTESLSPDQQKVEFIFYKFMDPFQKTFMMKEFVRMLQSTIIDEINLELQKNETTSGLVLVSDPSPLVVERLDAGARVLPPLSYSLASWSLFAIFFIVIPFSNAFFRDWNNHVFVRFRALKIPKTQVFGGRVLAYVIVNFSQFFFLLFLALFVFPVLLKTKLDFHMTSLFPLCLVIAASAIVATSFALFVSCVAKTQEQASALGAFSVVLLSLLGGIMIPTVFMPEYMTDYISVFSPLYWALGAFAEAFQKAPNFFNLGKQLGYLLLFAIVFYTVSLKLFRWEKT